MIFVVVVVVCLFIFVFYLIVYKSVDLRKLCITHPPITNQCEELALILIFKAIGGNQANLEYNKFLRK